MTSSTISDSTLPLRMTRERGILSSSWEMRAPRTRSSVSTTWVRVFFLLRPLRGMVSVKLDGGALG